MAVVEDRRERKTRTGLRNILRGASDSFEGAMDATFGECLDRYITTR